ncbi:Endopolyphosphatase [Ascobolus immersus RN42]|uniref:Endopolyphosphatase n=1 Tax=Ascobolus immersus RN42 TaxID=1160509 RepID=A0A3N4I4R5_ASCIM|nr:Endopolyphosphatase [Ascobolus immersus RN42]
MHPDMYYKPHASPAYGCHRKVKGSSEEKSMVGIYGAMRTNCDSPFALINATFDWLEDNLKNEVDFVIWTGDSARHDNDERIPRTNKEVWGLNELMAKKMMQVFGDPEKDDWAVPIVPTVGNNDILPHNVMVAGPTSTIRYYLQLWSKFIPATQYHVFNRGAYFWKQVLPGSPPHGKVPGKGGLAVMSLNTMYFFQNNGAVDGCDIESEPGYLEMEWLRAQLELMRTENMKVILIGHVPPARVKDAFEDTWRKRNWDETCWKKYALYTRQFRDIIVANIYGHMNLDHFILTDTNDALPPKKHKKKKTLSDPNDFSIESAGDYLTSLRAEFERLPKVTGAEEDDLTLHKLSERYSLALVSPSVVPNYFPTLRVFTYNTTDLHIPEQGGREAQTEDVVHTSDVHINKKKKDKKKPKKPTMPPGPPEGSLPGPAYSPQTFSLLGYTQYFANITEYNKRPDRFTYNVEYDTRTDEEYAFALKDGLTVRNFIRLAKGMVDARKIGRPEDTDLLDDDEVDGLNQELEFEVDATKKDKKKDKKKKNKGRKGGSNPEKDRLWDIFIKRAFTCAVPDEELQYI